MLSVYLPLKIYFSSLFFCQTEEEAFIKIYTSAKLIRHHLFSSKFPRTSLLLLLRPIIPPGAE